MADIKNITIDGTTYDLKDAKAREDVSDLKEDIDDLPEYGYVPTAGQMMSDNVTVDTEPYSYRATPYGDREIVDAIVGGTVAFNQLVKNDKKSGTKTVTGAGYADLTNISGIVTDHVVLCTCELVSTNDSRLRLVGYRNGAYAEVQSAWTKNGTVYVLTIMSAFEGTNDIYVRATGTAGDSISYDNFQFHDITQMFGTSVADAIYAMEQSTAGSGVAYLKAVAPKMFAQYNPYNAGELMSVSGLSAHETVGKNLFGGVYGSANKYKLYMPNGTPFTASCEVGSGNPYIYFFDENQTQIDYFNLTSTKGNRKYRTFTLNYDVWYFSFGNIEGTKYQIEYGSVPTAYEPYVKHSYALDDSLTLMGVPKWVDGKLKFDGDIYPPSGGVGRRYVEVDLGTLTWSKSQSTTGGFAAVLPVQYKYVNNLNIICEKWQKDSTVGNADTGYYPTTDKLFRYYYGQSVSAEFYVKDTAYDSMSATEFKAAMDGVMLVYEKATPTTETAEPYQSVQVCPNGGTEEYISTSIVPVGHSTRYPENSRMKLDGLPWDFSTLIAPTEKAYKATRNYTTGQLLIVNNILYKVTANIANGGTITPNTNVTATTLSEVIASL